jgi:transcriptional regulator with XRE-family HTH domain
MSTQIEEPGPVVPADTLAMRLVIARVHAGHHNAASAALAAGVSRQNWANWERGKPMRHADALLSQIAHAMGVDEGWLRHGGELRKAPHPDGPDEGLHELVVRHQGLEPRTRCFSVLGLAA